MAKAKGSRKIASSSPRDQASRDPSARPASQRSQRGPSTAVAPKGARSRSSSSASSSSAPPRAANDDVDTADQDPAGASGHLDRSRATNWTTSEPGTVAASKGASTPATVADSDASGAAGTAASASPSSRRRAAWSPSMATVPSAAAATAGGPATTT